jgi:hypothetical protein
MALNDVPLSTQTLSSTQPDIRTNFQVIDTAFEVDHVGFNDAGQGKHNQVTLPVQAGSPAIAAGDNAFYNLLNATTAKNEVYVHKQTNAGTADIPFTASILSGSTPALDAGGWSYLPSGLLLKFGNGTANGNTAFLFSTLNPTAPSFTQVLSIILCPAYSNASDGDGFVRLSNYTTAGFNAYGSARTTTTTKSVSFQFFAIGY